MISVFSYIFLHNKRTEVGDPVLLRNMYCYRMIRFHLILVNLTNTNVSCYQSVLRSPENYSFSLARKSSFSRYAKAPTYHKVTRQLAIFPPIRLNTYVYIDFIPSHDFQSSSNYSPSKASAPLLSSSPILKSFRASTPH